MRGRDMTVREVFQLYDDDHEGGEDDAIELSIVF
jgi:hypothetical protein